MSASCNLSCDYGFLHMYYKKVYTCESGQWTSFERPRGIHMRRKNLIIIFKRYYFLKSSRW